MKKINVLAFALAAFFSCEKKTTENTAVQNTDSAVSMEVEIEDETALSKKCYLEVTGNDSMFAVVDDNLGTVTGKLYYKNHQKDSSFGDIVGVSDGDTLKVDYTFHSEGTLSTREIWFLKKDGKLLEGIGESDKDNGSRYADYKKIKFEGGHSLSASDCNLVEKRLNERSAAISSQSASTASEEKIAATTKEKDQVKKEAEKPDSKKSETSKEKKSTADNKKETK